MYQTLVILPGLRTMEKQNQEKYTYQTLVILPGLRTPNNTKGTTISIKDIGYLYFIIELPKSNLNIEVKINISFYKS